MAGTTGGYIRQLFDYDGADLFPKTRPDAFVGNTNSSITGLPAIGDAILTIVPEDNRPEPEFVYRVNGIEDSGDVSGNLRAVKLSDIFNFANAYLTTSFRVTNAIGSATYDKEYVAGEVTLQDIIIDMLTDSSVYDVAATLVNQGISSFTNVKVNGTSISSGSSINLTSGDQATITFDANFADGWFGPSTGYDTETFEEYHSAQSTYDENTNRLYAGSNPTSMQLRKGGTVEYNATSSELTDLKSTGTKTFSKTITVESGNKVYVLRLDFSGKASSVIPYRSNHTVSSITVPAGYDDSYSFTIVGAGVTVYDVIANVPDINSSVFSGNELIIKSKYDIDRNVSTGIWEGDEIVISLDKGIRYTDGYFTGESGYDTFYTVNQSYGTFIDNNTKMLAECDVPSTSISARLNANASVNNINYTSTQGPQHEYTDISINETNKLLNGTAINGTNTIYLDIPYSRSQVVPHKSDDSSSSVKVDAGLFNFNKTFYTNTDRDVTASNNPTLSISNITIDGATITGNHITGKVVGDTIDGSFTYTYSDGKFRPESQYTQSTFETNNPGYNTDTIGVYHTANCSLNTISAEVTALSGYNSSINASTSSTTVTFRTVLDEELTISASCGYSNSNYTPIKLSTRESSINFPANTAVSNIIRLSVDTPVNNYHFLMLSGNNIYSTSYNTVVDAIADSSVECFNETNSITPTIYENNNNYDNVGRRRGGIIIAAPIDYKDIKIWFADTSAEDEPDIKTNECQLVPAIGDEDNALSYSASDNTKYRLFKYQSSSYAGYSISTIKLSKN